MKFIPILFSLLFVASLSAQNATILGVVTDASNHEPLLGVTIKSGNTGAISDANGAYQFQLPPGAYEISWSIPGYETAKKTIRLAATQTLTLNQELNSSDNLLQQVTVTSGKFEKPLGQVTVSLDVLKPRLIENTNSTSVDKVLTKVPGVSILDGQASIRSGAGFSYGAGTRVLLLVDDIPALQVDAGYPNWDDYPIENIAQIEVLKGAASALYGSSAMNGIINIRTGFAKDKPETEFAVFGKTWGAPRDASAKWWGTDSSEIVQPVETGASFVHRRKMGKLDMVVGAYSLYRDSYNRNTYSRYGRITPNFRYRVNDRLTIGLNSTFNLGRSGSFFIWGNDSNLALQPGLNSASFSKGRFRYTIDPSIQYIDRAGFRHKFLGRYYSINNNNSGNQSNSSKMYYGEYQIQRQLNHIGLVATAGVVGIRTRVNAELYGGKYASENLASYLQLDYNGIKNLNLSAGIRYEKNLIYSPEYIRLANNTIDTIPNGKSSESKPVFRLGANYQIGKATYLRASWGQAYRYPTIAEKFITTKFSTIAGVGPNPDLVSETGWSTELGIKQGVKIGSWLGYVDLAAFWQEYQQMMEFVFASFSLDGAVFQSKNQGDTRVRGLELSVLGQGKLGPGQLFVLAGFTKTDPRYKLFSKAENNYWGSSDTSKNVLKYRFRNTLKSDVEYVVKGFGLGVSAQYNSYMESIDLLFQEVLPGVKPFREKHKNGFTLLDLRGSYKVNKSMKISILCNNVLNTAYTLRPALMEAPRNYTLRLEWKI
ncbi:MAG: TonB-dependent receptor [Bacteroidetes bacterium]|nr:TonB-dependent receptor [Bacteroidota bacterium]